MLVLLHLSSSNTPSLYKQTTNPRIEANNNIMKKRLWLNGNNQNVMANLNNILSRNIFIDIDYVFIEQTASTGTIF